MHTRQSPQAEQQLLADADEAPVFVSESGRRTTLFGAIGYVSPALIVAWILALVFGAQKFSPSQAQRPVLLEPASAESLSLPQPVWDRSLTDSQPANQAALLLPSS